MPHMKKITFLFLLFCMTGICGKNIWAQAGKLPPFQIVQSNNSIFRAQQLPLGKPVVIVYFDTDCDHCHELMKTMMANIKKLQKASVAMVTYLPVEKVAKFARQYDIQKFSNIYMGTEGTTFFLKNYYKLSAMPFMALYTKNGDLVKTYPRENSLTELLTTLNALP